MNYDTKQGWIEAIMADANLTPATKVYAYGIFKHMFGNKDDAWPGAKGLSEATGLNDSQFYKYNRALVEAGYMEVTFRKGTSNHYRLTLPTSIEGGYPPSEEVGVPPERVGGTSREGTNTTSNTSTKTSKSKTTKGAAAPVDSSLSIDYSDSSLSLLREENLAIAFAELETLANADDSSLLEKHTAPVEEVDLQATLPPDPATPSLEEEYQKEMRVFEAKMHLRHGPNWRENTWDNREENTIRAKYGKEPVDSPVW